MRKFIVIRNILMILIIVYFLQGLLYLSGSIISKLSLMLYLLISAYFFIKVSLLRKNIGFVRAIVFFVIMIGFYYFIGEKSYITNVGIINTVDYLKSSGCVLLSFFSFYYLTRRGGVTSYSMFCFFIVYAVMMFFRYFYSGMMLQLEVGRDDIVNNNSYDIVCLIPYLFLFRDKKKNFIYIADYMCDSCFHRS